MSKSVYFFIVLFCLPLFAQDVNLEAEKEAIKEVCRKETMSFMNRDGFTRVKWNCHFPIKRNLKFPTLGKKIKRVMFETTPFFSSSPDDTMLLRL